MFFLLIRLLGLFCLLMSVGAHAQLVRPSTPSLSKFPLIQSGQGVSKSQMKPPIFVQNILIMIDPGHGGHDVGTQSISKPRYQEKSLNLVTAKFIRDFLQQMGYQVMMT